MAGQTYYLVTCGSDNGSGSVDLRFTAEEASDLADLLWAHVVLTVPDTYVSITRHDTVSRNPVSEPSDTSNPIGAAPCSTP